MVKSISSNNVFLILGFIFVVLSSITAASISFPTGLAVYFQDASEDANMNKEASFVEIQKIFPDFTEDGNFLIEVIFSNKGTGEGQALVKLKQIDNGRLPIQLPKYETTVVIPPNDIKKWSKEINAVSPSKYELIIDSDEDRLCTFEINPFTEAIKTECSKGEVEGIGTSDNIMEELFGKDWILIIGVFLAFVVIIIIAFKLFSREETHVEKQVKSGRNLLKSVEEAKKAKERMAESKAKSDEKQKK